MQLKRILFFGMGVLIFSSCGTMKRKKFLDHFTPLKVDTLSIIPAEDYNNYIHPQAPWSLTGTPIDTSFMHVFSLEEAEDLRYFTYDEKEKGPSAYYKVKLDLGYYFLVIRSGGEYWNSRYYACLYHSGENKVTHAVLIGETFGDGGAVFFCQSHLRKENKTWTIKVHEYFSEPLNYEKYKMDSLVTRETDILYHIEENNDRLFFVEKERK